MCSRPVRLLDLFAFYDCYGTVALSVLASRHICAVWDVEGTASVSSKESCGWPVGAVILSVIPRRGDLFAVIDLLCFCSCMDVIRPFVS